MHFIIINVEIPEGKKVEFVHAINNIINTSYSKIKTGIYQDVINKNIYRYWEEWESVELMKEHLKSDKFRALLGGMKVLGKILSAKSIQSNEVFPLEFYKND